MNRRNWPRSVPNEVVPFRQGAAELGARSLRSCVHGQPELAGHAKKGRDEDKFGDCDKVEVWGVRVGFIFVNVLQGPLLHAMHATIRMHNGGDIATTEAIHKLVLPQVYGYTTELLAALRER